MMIDICNHDSFAKNRTCACFLQDDQKTQTSFKTLPHRFRYLRNRDKPPTAHVDLIMQALWWGPTIRRYQDLCVCVAILFQDTNRFLQFSNFKQIYPGCSELLCQSMSSRWFGCEYKPRPNIAWPNTLPRPSDHWQDDWGDKTTKEVCDQDHLYGALLAWRHRKSAPGIFLSSTEGGPEEGSYFVPYYFHKNCSYQNNTN